MIPLGATIMFWVKMSLLFLFPPVLWSGIFTHASAAAFDYAIYQQFLEKHLIPERHVEGFQINVVDYESIHKDRDKPDSLYSTLLKQLEQFDPHTLDNVEDSIAFWINAYNIGAIKMIVDHYPVDSIRSLKINWLTNPWNKKIVKIGQEIYSLGQIEHDILLGRYKEPLIHFGIVCASLSCPDLSREVFEGPKVKDQLERRARRFLQDRKKGLRIDKAKGEVLFSKIFKFDKKTFPKGAMDAIPLIAGFIENDVDREYLQSKRYKVKYLDYNWNLNTLQNAQ